MDKVSQDSGMVLFQQFCDQEYERKVHKMQQVYASPLKNINEKYQKNREDQKRRGLMRKKIEDRLMELGR